MSQPVSIVFILYLEAYDFLNFTLFSVKFYYFKGGYYCFLCLGFGLWFVYLNILSKILVCGANDIVFILDLYLCLFVLLAKYIYIQSN